MGRYGTLTLIREDQVPFNDAVIISRMSWVGHFIVSVFLLGWVAVIGYFVYSETAFSDISSILEALITAFFALVIGAIILVCLIAGLAFLSSALAAMKPDNWVLLATDEGIYIKLRSYYDHQLSSQDRIVVFIPRNEIKQVRSSRQKTRVVYRGDNFTNADDDSFEKYDFLEIKLYGHDLSEIEECLEIEKRRNCPTFLKGVTKKARGTALKIQPKGIIKLDWKTKATRITPAIDTIITVLSQHYASSAIEGEEQAAIKSLNKEEQEKRLLELASIGNMMDAVILARELYGFDLTEAKRFIDELSGR